MLLEFIEVTVLTVAMARAPVNNMEIDAEVLGPQAARPWGWLVGRSSILCARRRLGAAADEIRRFPSFIYSCSN